MFTKRILTIFVALISLVILVGCSTVKITDFEGMSDLTRFPIVYVNI